MSKSADFNWSDFWAIFRSAETEEAMLLLASALNWSGPFGQWLFTRADKVQAEVMEDAPISVLLEFGRALSPKALIKIHSKRPTHEQARMERAGLMR